MPRDIYSTFATATLMAQVFDPERGQLKGDAHAVAERGSSDKWGRGIFDVSENGVLIYTRGVLARRETNNLA